MNVSSVRAAHVTPWQRRLIPLLLLVCLLLPSTAMAASQQTPDEYVAGSAVAATSESVAPAVRSMSGRWIDVNLSRQRLTAYQGTRVVYTSLASTGLPRTPTVTGRFAVQRKLVSTLMRGPGYYLPKVPYTMYFYGGYAIHGTYWHHNFGHPMSHGCVNLPTPAAAWLFNWASVGTPVVVHY
jgi:lipoprotein-anchoring transpeptidase ErfK/SrfK